MKVNAKKKEKERIQELGNMCGHFVVLVWVFYCRFELVLFSVLRVACTGLDQSKKSHPIDLHVSIRLIITSYSWIDLKLLPPRRRFC